MRGRTRPHGGANWRRALALSFAFHALGLLVIGIGASATTPAASDGSLAGWVSALPIETPTMVDLAAIDTLAPLEVVPSPTPAQPADLSRGIPDDQARAGHVSAAPPVVGGPDRRVPSPDRGAGQGRAVEDPAWRRDDSTLHERLSDGAERYQPAHTRTASRATSPQAVRRETRTGLGDSVKTQRAQRTPVGASYGVAEPDPSGPGSAMSEGVSLAASPVTPNPALPEAERAFAASSTGPLEAERGTRSFDVEAPGVAATDNRAARAASHEDHPGITDLTLAAAPGIGATGRGPADQPGAVPRATIGAAPSRFGQPGPAGAGDNQRTEERRYDRYKQQIHSRVDRARDFPRALALRLEQGETLLRFIVLPDGSLGDGIQVIKSSGFTEFDQAAVDAVRKASPFGPMPDPGRATSLPVNLLVKFPNPVVR